MAPGLAEAPVDCGVHHHGRADESGEGERGRLEEWIDDLSLSSDDDTPARRPPDEAGGVGGEPPGEAPAAARRPRADAGGPVACRDEPDAKARKLDDSARERAARPPAKRPRGEELSWTPASWNSHALMRTGPYLWCCRCGRYVKSAVRGLKLQCLGQPSDAAAQWRLDRLATGRDPYTGRAIEQPQIVLQSKLSHLFAH